MAGFGYPIYIALRRYYQINSLATFLVELVLLLPFALYYIIQVDQASILMQNEYLYFYLALLGLVNGMAFILYIASSNLLPINVLGLVNGMAFILYIAASNTLPINVLGLLGYAEPLVMLFISFAIGEVLEAKSYILMACLAISVGLLTMDSFRGKNVQY